MPAIPAKTLEQMWAKVENAVSRTTGLVQVWNSKGSSTGNASVWALDLTLQQGWGKSMLGDRDERVVIGCYVSRDFNKPKEALTVELKDRSVNRNSVYNPLVKPRLLPCAAHWRLVCKLALGHKKLVVWEAITPNPHYIALGMLATTTEEPPGQEELRCVPRSWCVESEMREKVWEDSSGRGLYMINSLGFLAASNQAYMPPKGPFFDIKKELRTGHKFALGHHVNAGVVFPAAGVSRSFGMPF